MGILRGGALIILSALLLVSLFLTGVFYTLSLSLSYENVQHELGFLSKNFTDSKLDFVKNDFNLTERMDKALKFMKKHCVNETSYVFSEQGYTFVVPCDVLQEADENPQVLVDVGIENIVEQIYYDDYNCGFLSCLKEEGLPFFLVSEKAQNYWEEKFYYALVLSLALTFLVFLFVEQKENTLLVVGSLIAVASLPLLKIEQIVGSVAGDSYLSFIKIFFNESGFVFWIMIIFGLVLFLGGVALKFWHKDSLKKKFSKEDVKKIVKEELENKKEGKKKIGKKSGK